MITWVNIGWRVLRCWRWRGDSLKLRHLYLIGQRQPVEHRRRFIADDEHEFTQAAIGFGQAVFAGLRRETAGAGDE